MLFLETPHQHSALVKIAVRLMMIGKSANTQRWLMVYYPLRHASPKLFVIRKALILCILGGSGHILMRYIYEYLTTTA